FRCAFNCEKSPRRFSLTAHRSAALPGDGDDARARLRAGAVGPVTARLGHAAALARMLNAEEQRCAIRRELAAADLGADRAAHELLQPAALWTRRRTGIATVVRGARLRTVRDDPQIPA